MIKKTVFFPGKFHPPHLGHAKTILDLIAKYEKVIVGVSGDIPNAPICTVDTIYDILSRLFTSFENVELIKITGILVEKKDLSGLPWFDVMASGNPLVLEWAEAMGLEGLFVERAEGYLFSGTEVRDELRNS